MTLGDKRKKCCLGNNLIKWGGGAHTWITGKERNLERIRLTLVSKLCTFTLVSLPSRPDDNHDKKSSIYFIVRPH